MSASKTMIVGVLAFTLGVATARLITPRTVMAQQQTAVSVTMKGDVATIHNSTNSGMLVLGLDESGGGSGILSTNNGDVQIPTGGSQPLKIYQFTSSWVVQRGVVTDCRPAEDCPKPPCPPPNQCPWHSRQVMELWPPKIVK
jgi:hypothetical protein